MPSNSQRFLKVTDVAEVLNVSQRQVLSLLASGELRGIQIGGRGIWRVEVVELENYIKHQYEKNEEKNEERRSHPESTEPD